MIDDPLFAPRGIAVVGASAKPTNMGRRVLEAMRVHGFAGDLAAVHPDHDEVDGVACFPSVAEVPFQIDLVLLFLAASRVADVVAEAARVGAGAAVVFTSGFAEVGAEGAAAQDRLRWISTEHGIRILGPNCQGLVDFRTDLAATFTPAVLNADPTRLADVAYVGQSGAVGGVFFDLARQRGVTPTAWVSTGNELDVTVADAATTLLRVGPLDLLCLYLEQVPEGTSWLELVRLAGECGTRIAILRSGRSEAGRRAAATHTGALVGDDMAFRLMCAEHGVIEVDDIAELVEIAVATAAQSRHRGSRVAVVTTSGGVGGLAADRLVEHGLTMAELMTKTRDALAEILPVFATSANPVDVTADLMVRAPESLARVCDLVAADPNVDQVLLTVTNLVGAMADTVATTLAPSVDAPLSVAYLAASDRTEEPAALMTRRGLAVHPSVRAAVIAMAALSQSPPVASRPISPAISDPPLLPPGPVLTEWAATPLLDWAAVPRPAGRLERDVAALGAAVAHVGGRAVVKVQSPEIPHKSDVGGVRVGVTAEEAEIVGARMLADIAMAEPAANLDGFLVQGLAAPGVELLVGLRRGEGGYPPTVTVGMGGTRAELDRDVVTSFAPICVDDAHNLLRRLRGYPLLAGYRGSEPCDVSAAASAIARLSRAVLIPDLVELEINPLVVHSGDGGVTALDLLVRKEPS